MKAEASNLSKSELTTSKIKATMNEMAASYRPIALTIKGKQKLLFLKDSAEVKQLYWLPYLQFGVLGLLVLVGYLLFQCTARPNKTKFGPEWPKKLRISWVRHYPR